MDREQEAMLVKAFFNKRVQERILFELCSPKKRLDALSRLCHNFDEVLDERWMIEIPKPNSDATQIAKMLRELGAREECYVVSWSELDGQKIKLVNALQRVVGLGMPSIVCYVPAKLAYFEAEQECGSPPRYILKRI